MNEFDELKKEILDSKLAGQANWTEDTKIAFSIERIKTLNKKVDEFNNLVKQMQEKVDRKIERLRENWRMDETIKEIKQLESAVKIAFAVPVTQDEEEEEETRTMKNPFISEEE